MLSLLEFIPHSSSVFLEDIKVIAVLNWIFHVSGRLRLFMISFKYGLISSTYYLTDSVFFYHHYFHVQYNCPYEKYQPLLVFNNFIFFDSARALISLIILSLIASIFLIMLSSIVLSSIVLLSVLGKYTGILIFGKSRGLENGRRFVGVHKGIRLNTSGLYQGIDILGPCGLVNRPSIFLDIFW